MKKTLAVVCILTLLFSCHRKENEAMYARLQQWDSILSDNPYQAKDSLSLLNPQKLSRSNRAYYGLLTTIADDKTYTDFTSDSLINAVEKYYSRNQKGSAHHIRSLIYQGMVRMRMNVSDTTVLRPLKEAKNLLLRDKHPDAILLYLAYYYLADVHDQQGNLTLAESYFRQTVKYAHAHNDSSHIFDSYMALYWNLLKREKNDQAAPYLDTINTYCHSPRQKYFLLNAQSSYWELKGEYAKSLHAEKEQLAMTPLLKQEIHLYRLYYTVSEAFQNMGQLDSALLYAQKSIESITDTTYQLNYLIYEKVAEIAKDAHKYKMADEYREKALRLYEQSLDKQKTTQLMELEKRYDLSEAQNEALRMQRRNRMYITVLFLIILAVSFLLLYTRKQHVISSLQKREADARAQRMEAEKALWVSERGHHEKMIRTLGDFLTEYASQQEQAREMTNKIKSRDTRLGDEYDSMLKQGQRDFTQLTHRVFTQEGFEKQFGICDTSDTFSESDRLFLLMLAEQAPNEQIAALLHTTPHNLKTRKSYLKKKIIEKATSENHFSSLLPLFGGKN